MTKRPMNFEVPLQEMDAFQAQMEEINRTAQDVSHSLASGLKSALVDGKSLESVFRSIALTTSSRILSSALRPLENLVGQAVSTVLPFAKGGIVASPTLFGMQGTAGLMGEAGPEAILPLARGTDGRLGLRSGNGGPDSTPKVHITIKTRDVESFRRSEAQVSAIVARAVGRGRRGL